MRTPFIATAVAIAIALAATLPAAAGIEITRSTAPGLKVGARLADDAILKVPAGTEISVLKTPENTTHTIRGEHDGTLAAYLASCPAWRALIGLCKSGDEAIDEGGTRAVPTPGATRRIDPDVR